VDRVYLEYLGNLIEIPLGETHVGRDLDCAIRLDDAGVSRHHLRVVRRGPNVFVEDLGSRNGSYVNGKAIAAPVPVRDGDVVVLSSRVLTVRVNATDRAKRATLARSVDSAADLEAARAATMPPEIKTQPIAIVGHKRCPRCGSDVSDLDDECASCGFAWGSFDEPEPDDAVVASLRRHPRRPIAVELRYVSSELEIEVISRDLSESGVFVCSQVLDPVGTECHLTLDLAVGPLDAHGVVRRVVEHGTAGDHPVGLGVEFIDLGRPERAWLRDLIAHRDDARPRRSTRRDG